MMTGCHLNKLCLAPTKIEDPFFFVKMNRYNFTVNGVPFSISHETYKNYFVMSSVNEIFAADTNYTLDSTDDPDVLKSVIRYILAFVEMWNESSRFNYDNPIIHDRLNIGGMRFSSKESIQRPLFDPAIVIEFIDKYINDSKSIVEHLSFKISDLVTSLNKINELYTNTIKNVMHILHETFAPLFKITPAAGGQLYVTNETPFSFAYSSTHSRRARMIHVKKYIYMALWYIKEKNIPLRTGNQQADAYLNYCVDIESIFEKEWSVKLFIFTDPTKTKIPEWKTENNERYKSVSSDDYNINLLNRSYVYITKPTAEELNKKMIECDEYLKRLEHK